MVELTVSKPATEGRKGFWGPIPSPRSSDLAPTNLSGYSNDTLIFPQLDLGPKVTGKTSKRLWIALNDMRNLQCRATERTGEFDHVNQFRPSSNQSNRIKNRLLAKRFFSTNHTSGVGNSQPDGCRSREPGNYRRAKCNHARDSITRPPAAFPLPRPGTRNHPVFYQLSPTHPLLLHPRPHTFRRCSSFFHELR